MAIEEAPNMPSSKEGWRRELEVRRQSLDQADQALLGESGPANLEVHNEHQKALNRIMTIDAVLESGGEELSRDELRKKVYSDMGTAFINSVFKEEAEEIEKMKSAV